MPKIDFTDGDKAEQKTKTIFLKMLRSMKDFPSKVFTDANLKIDRMNLYEVFIRMYLLETRSLVKRGLQSGYITQRDNLKYYKGKLQINRHIQMNAAHKERFYVEYDEFQLDRPENRLVKSTLLYLQKHTEAEENAKEARQLLAAFEMVEESRNYQKDFSKVVIDRSNKSYEKLIEWAKVFLLNKSFTTFSGSGSAQALLFPMESVYESYVARQMKKVFEPEGWQVSCQDKGKYLFTEPQEQFRLRPDLVLKKDNRMIIMDTKWKRLVNNRNRNYGISQGDMYQMYAYSKKYETGEIWLLYPANAEMRHHKEKIVFKSGDGATVHVFFIELDQIENNLNELLNALTM